jgi:hypothetical protein
LCYKNDLYIKLVKTHFKTYVVEKTMAFTHMVSGFYDTQRNNNNMPHLPIDNVSCLCVTITVKMRHLEKHTECCRYPQFRGAKSTRYNGVDVANGDLKR